MVAAVVVRVVEGVVVIGVVVIEVDEDAPTEEEDPETAGVGEEDEGNTVVAVVGMAGEVVEEIGTFPA